MPRGLGEPWLPFASRGDFEFAEFAADAALNEAQSNAIIKLIHQFVNGADKFTLTSHSELQKTWNRAADLVPRVGDTFIL